MDQKPTNSGSQQPRNADSLSAVPLTASQPFKDMDQKPTNSDSQQPRNADSLSAVPLTASQPFKDISKRSRGYLPHWETEGSIYFVTYRLADSLPPAVLERIELERNQQIDALIKSGRHITPAHRKKLTSRFSKKIDDCLDKGHGSCALARPEAAEIIRGNLYHFEGRRYRLFAWCIMPNHVHVVLKPILNHQLSKILQSWKSYTANRINEVLERNGRLWQPERYDRLIRDEAEFWRICEYVVANPQKAGLNDWQWVWWCVED